VRICGRISAESAVQFAGHMSREWEMQGICHEAVVTNVIDG
jgi:hypothetical protein